jgi:hypothetical protein
MIFDIHDTVPSPSPIETIPPSDTIPNNPLPEITEVDNLIPQQMEPELIIIPDTTTPLILLLISIAALVLSAFYWYNLAM